MAEKKIKVVTLFDGGEFRQMVTQFNHRKLSDLGMEGFDELHVLVPNVVPDIPDRPNGICYATFEVVDGKWEKTRLYINGEEWYSVRIDNSDFE